MSHGLQKYIHSFSLSLSLSLSLFLFSRNALLYFDDQDKKDGLQIDGQIDIKTKASSITLEFHFGDVESRKCQMEIGRLEAKVKNTPFDFIVNYLVNQFKDEISKDIPGNDNYFVDTFAWIMLNQKRG